MLIKVKDKPSRIEVPEDMARVLYSVLNVESDIDKEKEHFWVIGLTNRKTIKYLELVSLGILNASMAHPREIFRFAISQAIDTIIVAHNHPSGYLVPSNEDNIITRQLIEAGKIIGIRILDHIIIGNDGQSFYCYQRDSDINFN